MKTLKMFKTTREYGEGRLLYEIKKFQPKRPKQINSAKKAGRGCENVVYKAKMNVYEAKMLEADEWLPYGIPAYGYDF